MFGVFGVFVGDEKTTGTGLAPGEMDEKGSEGWRDVMGVWGYRCQPLPTTTTTATTTTIATTITINRWYY